MAYSEERTGRAGRSRHFAADQLESAVRVQFLLLHTVFCGVCNIKHQPIRLRSFCCKDKRTDDVFNERKVSQLLATTIYGQWFARTCEVNVFCDYTGFID
jgi:hypothetical protein